MKNVLYKCIGALLAALAFNSCNDGIDIRQDYDFSLSSWYLQKQISADETVEIRLEIKPSGNFIGTVYTLRYFQPDGKGSLKMEDGTVLKPNDRYLLNEWKFRLYYTSQSDKEAQTIDLYFEDNWGNLQQLTYDFNGKEAEEDNNNTEAA
mgnify:CR=1 FL=1